MKTCADINCALGGVMQVEKPALVRLLAQNATSVLVDGRAKSGYRYL
jgi:hypothetical protein